VEDLTNEQLDVLVAEKAMGWAQEDGWWFDPKEPVMVLYTVLPLHEYDANLWSPSTDIAHAFRVDRPEWEWCFEESGLSLDITIWDTNNVDCHTYLADLTIPFDPDNKTAAYCRGRCIAACYACGVTEVE